MTFTHEGIQGLGKNHMPLDYLPGLKKVLYLVNMCEPFIIGKIASNASTDSNR